MNGRRPRTSLLAPVVLGVLLFAGVSVALGGAWGSVSTSGPPIAPPNGLRVLGHPGAIPPHLGIGPLAGPRPWQTALWYLQAGATLAQVDGSGSATTVASLRETVVLHNSPYSTAYELNGLSTTGDWYQIVTADNWPGCNAGFEEAVEVWDNLGNSGPITCDANVTLSAADKIEFTLSFNGLGQGCLNLDDITTAVSHTLCQSQPDSGATGFQLLSGPANGRGYYSGMMTETINQTAPGCPTLTRLPTMTYVFPAAPYFTGYTPWSDEFDLASFTSCYQSANSSVTLSAADPTSHYAETAAGTGYGPHWVEGQNLTYVVPGSGFTVQTDPRPIRSVNLSTSATTVRLGASANLTTGGSGGIGPYSALWEQDGSMLGVSGLVRQFNATMSGNFTFQSYLVDRQNDVFGPSPGVIEQVPWGLWVSRPTAAPAPTGADIGQTVVFTAAAHGGIDPKSYGWAGLPSGCFGANSPTITCRPNATGLYNVSATVRDANGSLANSPVLAFRVSSAPSVQLVASSRVVDLNQSVNLSASPTGGAGAWTFQWNGLPPGCSSVVATFSCFPGAAGTFTLNVTVRDANSDAVSSSNLTLTVYVAPSLRLTVNTGLADIGQSLTFSAMVSGGGPGPTFSWTGLPTNCVSSTSSATCVVHQSGTWLVSVAIIDGAGGRASAGPVTISTFDLPTASVRIDPSSPSAGSAVSITAETTGGAGVLHYAWSGVPPGCGPAAAARVTCPGVDAGTYHVALVVTDATGARAFANASLVVPAQTVSIGSPPGLGLSGLEWVIILVGIGGVLAAVVAARQRRRRTSVVDESSAPP